MTQEEFFNRFQYEPERDHIGSGGFGEVYKAYDTVRKRHVAIKRSDVKPALKNFTLQREVQLANEIPPNDYVVRFENTFRFRMGHNEVDYAIMPFYKNGNLNAFLKANTLTLAQKQTLVMGILKGIKHLHDNDFIHRDLKSGNILIDDNGKPVIIDFGLSKLAVAQDMSYSNSAIGKSFEYAAPEQIQNRPIRQNIDIWAFGVIAYKIFTNTLPFTSAATTETSWIQELSLKITQNQISEHDLQMIHEPYRAIIADRCLVIDSNKRAQSADELINTIEQYQHTKDADTTINENVPVNYAANERTITENAFGRTHRTNTETTPSSEKTSQKSTVFNDKTTIDDRRTMENIDDEHDEEPNKSKMLFWIGGGVLALAIGGYWYSQKDNTPTTVTTNIENQDSVAVSAAKEVKLTIDPQKAAADAAKETKAQALKEKLKGVGKGEGEKNQLTKEPAEWSKEEIKIPDHAAVMQPKPVMKAAENTEDKIFTFVEEKPEFRGGQGALMGFLADNIRCPAAAREAGAEGKVVVSFVVSKTGIIEDIKLLRGVGYGCDQEALRVVSNMPRWKPGKQNGQAVRVQYTLPIQFKLD